MFLRKDFLYLLKKSKFNLIIMLILMFLRLDVKLYFNILLTVLSLDIDCELMDLEKRNGMIKYISIYISKVQIYIQKIISILVIKFSLIIIFCALFNIFLGQSFYYNNIIAIFVILAIQSVVNTIITMNLKLEVAKFMLVGATSLMVINIILSI